MAGFYTWETVLVLFLTLLLLNTNIAHAGHPAWETSRVERPQWLTGGYVNIGIQLWPGKKIRYCFVDDDARLHLSHLIRRGQDLWHASGLPNDFTIEEVTLEECDKNPETTLKIMRSLNGELASNIGLDRYRRGRPMAVLSEDPGIGVFDPVSNIAHELGHSWGLQHEMQNRLYWHRHGNPNEIFDWHCERIYGFDQIVEQHHLTEEQIWSPNMGMCYDGKTALHYRFVGTNWLPWSFHKLYYSPHATSAVTVYDVDWDSIMMYPSFMGVWEAQDDHDFNRATLLKSASILPEDRWIQKNMVPSGLDVEGLKILYGHRWPIPAPQLHGDPFSPFRHLFQQMAPGCYAS